MPPLEVSNGLLYDKHFGLALSGLSKEDPAEFVIGIAINFGFGFGCNFVIWTAASRVG